MLAGLCLCSFHATKIFYHNEVFMLIIKVRTNMIIYALIICDYIMERIIASICIGLDIIHD